MQRMLKDLRCQWHRIVQACQACRYTGESGSTACPKPEPCHETYVKRMAKKQRSSSIIFWIIALLAVLAIGVGLFVFKDQLFALMDKAQQAQPPKPTAVEPAGSLLVGKDEVLDERSGDLTQLQAPDKDKKTRRNLARIPAPYPGRALLIGIRNYLYLNPLNPGYRAERSFLRDPLGLHTLRRTLLTELSFPRDQVKQVTERNGQKVQGITYCSTRETTSSIERFVESRMMASAAGTSGETARVRSR